MCQVWKRAWIGVELISFGCLSQYQLRLTSRGLSIRHVLHSMWFEFYSISIVMQILDYATIGVRQMIATYTIDDELRKTFNGHANVFRAQPMDLNNGSKMFRFRLRRAGDVVDGFCDSCRSRRRLACWSETHFPLFTRSLCDLSPRHRFRERFLSWRC